MPGTGAFGWEYPGWSFEEDGGAATYEKVGTGVSAFVGSGSDVVEHAETGAGVAPFVSSGTVARDIPRAGTGIAPFVASGTKILVSADKTGSGISEFVASGADASTLERAGAAVAAFVGSGGDVVESAETGAAIAAFVGAGEGDVTHVETGAGIAPFVASGASDTALSGAGTAIAGFSGSGARESTFNRDGSGIAPFSGGGVRGAAEYVKVGTGILERTADGASAITYVEKGTGIVVRSAQGASEKNVARRNAGIIVFSGKGRQGDNVAGTASAGFVAFGDKTGSTLNKKNTAISPFGGFPIGRADIVVGRTGFTVRGIRGFGARAVIYAETGSSVLVLSANGTDFSAGTGTSEFTGFASDEITYTETGTGFSDRRASGWWQPAGVAFSEFTGGGVLRQLYANDNFVNREIVDAPTGIIELDEGGRTYDLAGATDRATTETGERLTTIQGNIERTLWWEIDVPFRCIVLLDVRSTTPFLAWGLANRGTAVNALSPYGDPTKHYGEDSGRGMDSSTITSSMWGSFPASSSIPLRVQVDPEVPLAINVGKRTSFVGPGQTSYRVLVSRLLPPTNDDPFSAYEIDPMLGSTAYDTYAATGTPLWNWTQFASVLYFPNSFKLSGDIFWSFIAPTSGTFRFGGTRTGGLFASDLQAFVFEGDDISAWTPIPVNIHSSQGVDYPYAHLISGANSGFAEALVEAGKTYYVALCQMRSVLFFPGFGYLSSGLTTTSSGTLFWEFVTVPSNDDFVDRVNLGTASDGSNTIADSRGSTAETDEPVNIWDRTAKGIWYEYSPTVSGWWSWTVDTTVVAYPRIDIFRNNTFLTMEASQYGDLYYPVWLRSGETYYIRLTASGLSANDYGNLNWDHQLSPVAANDDFANRQTISGSSGMVTVDLIGATAEADEPMMYWWYGNPEPSVWYDFTPSVTQGYRFRTDGPGGGVFDWAEIGVYTGTSLANLVPVARFSSEDAEVGFLGQAGTSYKIQLGWYPWYWPTSLPMALVWSPHIFASNMSFATATPIGSVSGSIGSYNFGADAVPESGTPDLAALLLDDFKQGRAVWYAYTPSVTGSHTFTLSSNRWDLAIGFFTGSSLGSLTPAIWSNSGGDPAVTTGGWGEDVVEVDMVTGTTYYILIVGINWPNTGSDWDDPADSQWAPDMIPQGEFILSWVGANINDSFFDADLDTSALNYYPSYILEGTEYGPITTFSSGGCVVASNIGATAEAGEPAHFPDFPATRSVWFRWFPGSTGTFRVTVEPAGAQPVQDPLFSVYNYATTFASLGLPIAQSDNFGGTQYPQADFEQAFTGGSRLIAVDARDEGTFKLKLLRIPDAAAPANDDFANAQTITVDTNIVGDTTGATIECDEPPAGGFWGGPYGSLWYTFTPSTPGAGFLEATVDNHLEGASTIFDIFQGTSFADLVRLDPSDSYQTAGEGETFGFPFNFAGGVPVYIRVSTDADGNYNLPEGPAGTFTFKLLVQSATPPANDNGSGATPVGAGTTDGTTDGATVEPGEPDGVFGGLLDPAAGSVWHHYTPDAPGHVYVYATRAGVHFSQWPEVALWAGPSREAAKLVPAVTQRQDVFPATFNNGAIQCAYEVRKDEKYWIQVIRRPNVSWGTYTLHVDPYLEYNEWNFDTDGFDSTVGSPAISGGVMTCTGNQTPPEGDEQYVDPMYGRVDFGAGTPKWGRAVRIYFEVKIVGGQVLRRQRWYGGERWSWSLIASDAHDETPTWTGHLGLMRAFDIDNKAVVAVSLLPTTTGENVISLDANGGAGVLNAPVSLGTASAQHDTGWVGIEVELVQVNPANYDGTLPSTAVNDYPHWYASMWVDGRPAEKSGQSGGLEGSPTFYKGKQIRKVDFGMWRIPTLYGIPGNPAIATDQRYVENTEAITYEMRRMRATNIVPREPYEIQFSGDAGVFEFDGFPSAVPFKAQPIYSFGAVSNRHNFGTSDPVFPPQTLPVVAAPDKPGWGAIHSSNTTERARAWYGYNSGSRRIYNFTMRADQFPATKIAIAGYVPITSTFSNYANLIGGGLATMALDATGELTIRPFRVREHCVAHMAEGSWYAVEVHVDCEVWWDCKTTIWINGQSFGTFSSAYSYSEVAQSVSNHPGRKSPAAWGFHGGYVYGVTNTVSAVHDMYFTNAFVGKGSYGGQVVGPLQSTTAAAVDLVSGHHLPDPPVDSLILKRTDGGAYQELYGWANEYTSSGPFTFTSIGPGHQRFYPWPLGDRFWEEEFVLQPTWPWREESTGSGNAWSGVGSRLKALDQHTVTASASGGTQTLKLTQFGQSVPIDSVSVQGIEVTVYRKASGSVSDQTVRLYKNGTLIGDNKAAGAWDTSWEVKTYGSQIDTWGTTWTPQEINADGFGVAIEATGSGTAEIDLVTVKVTFQDDGGPDNIGRGGALGPTGLYNFQGDNLVCAWTVTGESGNTHAAGFWSNGEPGSTRGGEANGVVSATPIQVWGSVGTLWLWQARGSMSPSVDWTGSTADTDLTVSDFRMVRNPLVRPRFAWSANDGATWTWIDPWESESQNHIGSDVSVSGSDVVFLDNNAALSRWRCSPGGWSSGLTQDRPTASPSYQYRYWYLAYTSEQTSETEVIAANLWARWRGYSGLPSTTVQTNSTWRAHVALPDGSNRRVGEFSQSSIQYYSVPTTSVDRFTQPRAPDGTAWTPANFNQIRTRIGYNYNAGGGSNSDNRGAAVYAMQWELLTPAPLDPPPAPCESPKYSAKITVKK